jgi:hypothetical protein
MKDKQLLIEEAKSAINALSQKQEELYCVLLESIGEIDYAQAAWLSDYCFNCQDDSDYTQYVRDKLYESEA